MFAEIAADLTNLGNPAALAVLLQVLIIDLSLAGENALAVGALAARLPRAQRRKALAIGVLGALVLRIIFALIATRLLQLTGLVLAGGLLLTWVAWKMWRETAPHAPPLAKDGSTAPGQAPANQARNKGLAWTVGAVALADLSMSLDNVLGVAGAAKDHPGILIVGLFFSVALTGVAANIIARYIGRHRWLTWVGITVILWVAVVMIWHGLTDARTGLLHVIGLA